MLKTDLDNSREIVELIRDLTQDEGDGVWIHNDNPDPGGPNCSITIIRRFEFDKRRQFFGKSVLDCLRQAKEA